VRRGRVERTATRNATFSVLADGGTGVLPVDVVACLRGVTENGETAVPCWIREDGGRRADQLLLPCAGRYTGVAMARARKSALIGA
jgi:hypothetical protein